MADVNNKTAKRPSNKVKGMKDTSDTNNGMEKKLPFPETYTNSQGSTNSPMDMQAPTKTTTRDFATEEFTTANKNPNNEAFPKTKQGKGANVGLGEIGRLANSDKWGQVGNS